MTPFMLMIWYHATTHGAVEGHEVWEPRLRVFEFHLVLSKLLHKN